MQWQPSWVLGRSEAHQLVMSGQSLLWAAEPRQPCWVVDAATSRGLQRSGQEFIGSQAEAFVLAAEDS